jgi:hypothetical protein
MKDDTIYLRHILECIRRIEANVAGGREQFMASHTLLSGCRDEKLVNHDRVNTTFVKHLEGCPSRRGVAAYHRLS